MVRRTTNTSYFLVLVVLWAFNNRYSKHYNFLTYCYYTKMSKALQAFFITLFYSMYQNHVIQNNLK